MIFPEASLRTRFHCCFKVLPPSLAESSNLVHFNCFPDNILDSLFPYCMSSCYVLSDRKKEAEVLGTDGDCPPLDCTEACCRRICDMPNNYIQTSGRYRALRFTKQKARSRRNAVILDEIFSVTNVFTFIDGSSN